MDPDTTPRQLPDVVLSLGTHRVPVVGDFEMAIRMRSGAHGQGTVSADDLAAGPAEYRAAARAESQGQQIYGGWVVTATPAGREVVLELDTGVALDEFRIGRLATSGMEDTELVWSVAQIAGLAHEQLHIQGLHEQPDAVLVAMPVEHITLSEDLYQGAVVLSRDAERIAQGIGPLRDSEEKAAFAAAGAWAIVVLQSGMLLAAEQDAIPRIDAALDRLALEAQFSLACGPDGTPLPFARSQLFSDPIARREVLVWGLLTGRRWLRSLVNPATRADLATRRLILPPPPEVPDQRFVEAVPRMAAGDADAGSLRGSRGALRGHRILCGRHEDCGRTHRRRHYCDSSGARHRPAV